MQDLRISVEHVFSCEFDPVKREFILDSHKDVKHVFDDNLCFEKKSGHCHICNCEHAISRENCFIDVLISGPSCKDLPSKHALP